MTTRMLLRLAAAMLAMLAMLVMPSPAFAQSDLDPVRYAKVKAGMVLNFARYATWPQSSFADEQSPLVITVLGRDPLLSELRRVEEQERVHGRSISIRWLPQPRADRRTGRVDEQELRAFHERLLESHVLYLASPDERGPVDAEDVRAVLEVLASRPVLTVSDMDDFTAHGGVLGLVVRRGRVAFNANMDAIAGTELKLSSKLLRLADNVISTESSP